MKSLPLVASCPVIADIQRNIIEIEAPVVINFQGDVNLQEVEQITSD